MTLYVEELKGRLYMLDFEMAEESPGGLTPSVRYNVVERDANRAVVRSYPQMQLFPRSNLRKGQVFLFVASTIDEARLEKRFPGAKIRQVQYRVYEITMPG